MGENPPRGQAWAAGAEAANPSGEEFAPFDPLLSGRLQLIADLPSLAMPDVHILEVEDDGEDPFMASVDGYVSPDVVIEDASLPGPHGTVGVRIYSPTTGRPVSGGLVWVHGGGYIWGDLDMAEADFVSRELCDRGDLLVVSVDYALARAGVSFPRPHDEVHAAWSWAVHSPNLLPPGADWALGGGSAGANLALGVAMRVRDAEELEPSCLVLCYPMVHERVPDFDESLERAMDQLPAALRFTDDFIRGMYRNYLGAVDVATPYAVAGEGNLSGLPPCLLVLSEYDDLRPSGETLVSDLTSAGVPVQRYLERGVPHGHLNIPGLSGAILSLDEMVDFVTSFGNRREG